MKSILNIIAVVAWDHSLSLSFLAVLIPLISFRYCSGIQKFRGPFLASFTDLWRFIHAYRGTLFPLRDLHDTYGDVVRVGPRALSFRDPQAIRDIFGAGKNWNKSGLYATNAPVSRGEWAHTLFSSPDQDWHRNVRRAMNGFFTQTAVFDYEPLIENTIETFLKELEHRFVKDDGNEIPLDLYTWISYFTFDVMSELTYSKRHGFIARSEDVHGIIGWVEKFLAYGNIVGQMPWVDSLLRHNPVLMWLERRGWYKGTTFPGARFALERIAEREQRKDPTAINTNHKIDLLDKFRQAKQEHPEHITMKEVLGLSLSTMIAGSEPSAIGLTAVLYYVLRTPACYQKLQQDLSSYVPLPASSRWPQIPFKTARSIPYLHACIQEGFRLHPPLAIGFERIVPSSGATICDNWIPGGTIVAVSPGVVQRHKPTFGDDVDSFRPERWLVDDEQKIRAMERAMFQYGAGNHMCLGRHIAVMEVYKLVASLMCTFEMSIVHPEKEWTVKNWGIARPKDFKIFIKRKENMAKETAS